MSNRLAPVAIISIAQQARPNVSGQTLDWRAQLIACSTVVVITFSSNRPSIQGWVIMFLRLLIRLLAVFGFSGHENWFHLHDVE
jgi:hypothetical protein